MESCKNILSILPIRLEDYLSFGFVFSVLFLLDCMSGNCIESFAATKHRSGGKVIIESSTSEKSELHALMPLSHYNVLRQRVPDV